MSDPYIVRLIEEKKEALKTVCDPIEKSQLLHSINYLETIKDRDPNDIRMPQDPEKVMRMVDRVRGLQEMMVTGK